MGSLGSDVKGGGGGGAVTWSSLFREADGPSAAAACLGNTVVTLCETLSLANTTGGAEGETVVVVVAPLSVAGPLRGG